MSLKSSLYGRYIREREGAEILESTDGFIKYKIVKDECHLLDAYTEEHVRSKGVFKKLFKDLLEISRKEKCKIIIATVYLADPNHKNTLKVATALGVDYLSANNNCIVLTLETGE